MKFFFNNIGAYRWCFNVRTQLLLQYMYENWLLLYFFSLYLIIKDIFCSNILSLSLIKYSITNSQQSIFVFPFLSLFTWIIVCAVLKNALWWEMQMTCDCPRVLRTSRAHRFWFCWSSAASTSSTLGVWHMFWDPHLLYVKMMQVSIYLIDRREICDSMPKHTERRGQQGFSVRPRVEKYWILHHQLYTKQILSARV